MVKVENFFLTFFFQSWPVFFLTIMSCSDQADKSSNKLRPYFRENFNMDFYYFFKFPLSSITFCFRLPLVILILLYYSEILSYYNTQ